MPTTSEYIQALCQEFNLDEEAFRNPDLQIRQCLKLSCHELNLAEQFLVSVFDIGICIWPTDTLTDLIKKILEVESQLPSRS
jgi:hypothetical protein